MRLIDVANRPDLKKDVDSGAIYFNDGAAIRKHTAMKQRNKKDIELRQEVESIKNDLESIKSMIATLINK
jgi:hypothetical protein